MTAQAWTAIGTVLLAVVTVGLVWIAKQQSDTTRAQLRAYVHVEKATIKGVTQKGAQTGSVVLKNFGQTPAYKTAIWLSKTDASFPAPKEFNEPELRVSNLTLAPGHNYTVNLSDQNWPGKRYSPNWALYVYGRVEYIDCFDCKRTTNFRLYKGGSADISGADLILDSDGNQAT